ncbi:hypothetical protein Ais01nite_63620 [Asanoa ishikariensis]|uniref:Secreted protein n=1 Tax=Asanoa ishikariensis TaxID=137265 RepID=A0A1H3NV27_9ACTN|nr:hypothetical protein [Asanoa ishikariensis]GIF68327.1 hypothetical protein Ais01nite_63620 [Asanoa ishikariensis]SDY92806.1 hypothetical protein SAMN05421684_2361 [Asanoa ishikariensis]
MDTLIAQLPVLIGVLIGTLGTIAATTLTDRSRWRRTVSVRWDERRLDAYVAYASAVKEIHALLFRITADDRPGSLSHRIDRDAGLALLAEADAARTKAWEKVLMLGDAAAVTAARDWRQAVRKLEFFALGIATDWERWDGAVRDVDDARDRFYVAARASLTVGGGSVAQSPWLAEVKLAPEQREPSNG